MRKFLLLACVCLLAGAASATVTYTTVNLGSFSCSNGGFTDSSTHSTTSDSISGCSSGSTSITLTDTAANGGTEAITLSFAGIANTVNALSGTVAPYGSITATCVGAGCETNATDIGLPTGILTITVSIKETNPDGPTTTSAGNATISGPIGYDSSTMMVGSYSSSPVIISGTDVVTYTLDTSDELNSPSENAVGGTGVTGLQMTITDQNAVQASAPEPASLAMMGVGLLAVGLFNRRRRQN